MYSYPLTRNGQYGYVHIKFARNMRSSAQCAHLIGPRPQPKGEMVLRTTQWAGGARRCGGLTAAGLSL